jgi:hypothetical protein
MLGTLIVNLFVTVYEKKVGTEINSTILVSDAMHTRSDVFVTIGVITSMTLIYFGFPNWIDAMNFTAPTMEAGGLTPAFFIVRARGSISGSGKESDHGKIC